MHNGIARRFIVTILLNLGIIAVLGLALPHTLTTTLVILLICVVFDIAVNIALDRR